MTMSFGIKRNASGYYDPTAFTALKSVIREEKKMTREYVNDTDSLREIRKGGIYSCKLASGLKRKVIIVSANDHNADKSVGVIILNDRPVYKINIPVAVGSDYVYANVNRLSYVPRDGICEKLDAASDTVIEKIDKAIMTFLGIATANSTVQHDALVSNLEKELREKDDSIRSLCRELEEQDLKQVGGCNESGTNISSRKTIELETERNLYRNLYESTLAKLIERN